MRAAPFEIRAAHSNHQSSTSHQPASKTTQAPKYEECLDFARRQDYDAASSSFEKLLAVDPTHEKAWISYAQMSKKRYKALGQNSLAFEACAAVLSRGTQALPHGARLWQARGLLELQQGRTDQARGLLEKAVELDPKLAPVLNWKSVRAQDADTD